MGANNNVLLVQPTKSTLSRRAAVTTPDRDVGGIMGWLAAP